MTYLGRQGNPLDRGITLRDLLDTGLAQLRSNVPLSNSGNTPPIEPPPGSDPPPDFTPPPTPSNFDAVAGLTQIFVTTDLPGYTQGRGHLRTRVFGAKYTTGPLPTIANATEIGQYTGPVFVFASDLGTTWHLWVRWESNDGVIGAPAGGTNGKSVTTGKVNGENDILANTIVGSRLFAATITGDKIAANTITALNIAANTITGDRIASNTITANKLNVNTLSAVSALIGLLRTASSGARLELSDNVIKVFDSAGNLRVKIGNLSL